MKRLLTLLLLFTVGTVSAQAPTQYVLRYDTVKVEKSTGSGNAEWIIKNAQRNVTGGIAYNRGNGWLGFKSLEESDIPSTLNKKTIYHHSGKYDRNDQASICKLPNGDLLLAWTVYTTVETQDGGPASIEVYKSSDQGQNWKPLTHIANFEAKGIYIPSFYVKDDGQVVMLLLGMNDETSSRIYKIVSSNHGLTWSTPSLVYGNGIDYYNVAADRIFKTKTGRLLYPIQKNTNGILYSGTGSYIGYTLYSDDFGDSWILSSDYVESPDNLAIENGYYQVRDTVFQYWRSRSGKVFASKSIDNGITWGVAFDLGIKAANSQTTIVKTNDGNALIAAYNSVIDNAIHGVAARHYLDLAVSSNGGKTWKKAYQIEGSLDSNYIEPTIFDNGNNLLIIYSPGDNSEAHFSLKQLRLPKSYVYPLSGSETLQSVTENGSISTNGISVKELSVTGNQINFYGPTSEVVNRNGPRLDLYGGGLTLGMAIMPNGDVGVRNITPTPVYSGANRVLHLTGSANGSEIVNQRTGGTSKGYFVQSVDDNTRLGTSGSKPLILETNLAERLVVHTSGNISIGSRNDVNKLDVTGTGSFTGTVSVGAPTASTHATTKSYVDNVVASGSRTQLKVENTTSYPGANIEILPYSLKVTGPNANTTVSEAGLIIYPQSGSGALGMSVQADAITGSAKLIQLPNASGKSAVITASPPASATAAGVVGEIRVTTTHVYFCTAPNTWVRAAVSSW